MGEADVRRKSLGIEADNPVRRRLRQDLVYRGKHKTAPPGVNISSRSLAPQLW
jgi:hypothetical protein